MLSPDLHALLAAYAQGLFPMADSRHGEVSFYRATRRSIIPLADGGLIIPRSLRAAARKTPLTFTTDTAFAQVISACADTPRQDNLGTTRETWINDWIIDTYTRLHHAGHAHSIEAWATDAATGRRTLVGGLYGVHLGGAFFGESMFSRPDLGGTNASKIALVHLWHLLRSRGFALLDTQLANEHMRQFGIVEVTHAKFAKMLASATTKDADWPAPGDTMGHGLA
ncbi:MAG: leucyl/phenylalanyl-tRNA--protein transferase [Phycisphaerales bacterium]|nr:leucyl/phenylalanyl-tRNA--protein transferase [Phycisphaerales bacterium]